LRDTFRCTRFVAQPRSSAPNIWQISRYSDDTSKTQHNIKNVDQADTGVSRDVMLCYQASGS
jgi:N-acyl-L-homoserine lactone synthetase